MIPDRKCATRLNATCTKYGRIAPENHLHCSMTGRGVTATALALRQVTRLWFVSFPFVDLIMCHS